MYDTPDKKVIRAIRSILNQSVPCEILVINDGGRRPELNAYASNVVYVEHDQNCGGAKALNTGIEHSHGTYVGVLDSDDYFTDPEKLKKQIAFLEDHPEVGAVGTGVMVIQTKYGSASTISVRAKTDPEELLAHMLKTSPLVHSTVMFRRVVLEKLKAQYGYVYDETLRRGKDWDIFLRIAKQYKLANLPDITVTYEDVWSPRKRFRDSRVILKILWKYRNHYTGFWKNIPEALLRYCYFFFRSYIVKR